MFGLFASVERKTRQAAAHWLELADKVYHYRRDRLPASDVAALQQHAGSLRQQLRQRDDASKLKLGIERLEGVLRRTGGTFYPKSSLTEYVEFFLVAAIVILGIRTYFVQPFKIPTNSMWPSYYGMTGEVFQTPAEEPGPIASAARFAAQLASRYRIDAPEAGEVQVPVTQYGSNRNFAAYRMVPGRKWLVIPTQEREYQLLVGRTPVTIRVPADFDMDRVLLAAFFDGAERFPTSRSVHPGETVRVRTGRTVAEGERVLSFDILTGDQLFVDRMSYHFVRPQVGQGFVFRTENLPELHRLMPGSPTDQYYIKRLVGTPGDRLEIRAPALYRNGEPIEGSVAFEKNSLLADDYPGYRNEGWMAPGRVLEVPPDHYLALGDNSASSMDGRYWGAIPGKDVVGRPLFIYYPFTRRWGPAP